MSVYKFVRTSTSGPSGSTRLYMKGKREDGDHDAVVDGAASSADDGKSKTTTPTSVLGPNVVQVLSHDASDQMASESFETNTSRVKTITTQRVVRKTTTVTRGEQRTVNESMVSTLQRGDGSTSTSTVVLVKSSDRPPSPTIPQTQRFTHTEKVMRREKVQEPDKKPKETTTTSKKTTTAFGKSPTSSSTTTTTTLVTKSLTPRRTAIATPSSESSEYVSKIRRVVKASDTTKSKRDASAKKKVVYLVLSLSSIYIS